MKTHYVLGCGGVGSWLAPSLCLLVGAKSVVLVDGDTLEQKNMNRQLFTRDDIGKGKAVALAAKYQCESDSRYYSFGCIQHDANDWLFVCVDNNPARLAALRACDQYGCKAIIAANEVMSSEAYVYLPRWKGTGCDPRVFYPELMTNHGNDPLAPAGCTGEAQERTRQLVSANFQAAALAQSLFVLWGLKANSITRQTMTMMPHHYRANISRLETLKIENKLNQRTENE